MPAWLLEVYADAIPTLQAREALHAVTVHAVGSGAAKQGDRDRILRQWQRDSRSQHSRRPEPSTRDVAAMVGIRVTTEAPPDE